MVIIATDIDGRLIRCTEDAGHRKWTCDCAEFIDRHHELGEGFCTHTAKAIMQAILAGKIPGPR